MCLCTYVEAIPSSAESIDDPSGESSRSHGNDIGFYLARGDSKRGPKFLGMARLALRTKPLCLYAKRTQPGEFLNRIFPVETR